MLPVTQIDTFYNGLTLRHRNTINVAAGETFMKRHPKECYDLIENMTAHYNDWDIFVQRSELSSSITFSCDPEIVALKAEMAEINKNLIKVLQINQQVKVVTYNYETCGGPHSYNDSPATVGQTQNVYAAGAYNQGGNSYQPQRNRNLLSYRSDNYLGPPGFNQNQKQNNQNQNYQNQNRNQGNNNTITNPKEDLKGINNQSGNAYQGPTIPATSSPPKVVKRETEVTKETMPPTNNESTKDVQPSVVQIEIPIPNFEPVVTLVDAPFCPTIKSLLINKEKLFELAKTPHNDHCSAVLLKKLPEKLGDPDKFLIPCDFLRMDESLALADLRASINLMPLSVWNKLSLPKLSPTCMTLELTDHSISHPVRVTQDVFVKVFNQIDLIDVACEEYSQEVLGFFVSGNPTPSTKPIVSTYSPTLTPFGDSDFLLEEIDAFLAIDDEPISLEINNSYYDSEGDILLLEEF
nr:reverse transcriptase domain-containing protein [Tanacetum cinerariifolium]